MSSITYSKYDLKEGTEKYKSTQEASDYRPQFYNSSHLIQPNYYHSQHYPLIRSPHHPTYSEKNSMREVRIINNSEKNQSTVVFCPVCVMNYSNSDIQGHLERHYELSSTLKTEERNQNLTQEIIQDSNFSYPLIEPLQFYTNQLDQVHLQGNILSKTLVNNKIQQPVLQYSDMGVQTLKKPPLQYSRQQTDLYNFMDNAFTSKSKFSIDDVFANNAGLASKRHLNQWQEIRHSKM